MISLTRMTLGELQASARRFFTPLVLTKLSLLTLLSVQIGFQPLLMGWYAREARHVSLRVGVIELMKLVMGLLPLLLTGEFAPQLKNWSLHVALQTTAAPALIYVLQNYLNQAAVVVLDGVTFNILNQTKIIWTALLVYLMLRRYQSRQQILALTILCAAAVLMTTGKTRDLAHTEESDAAFFTGAYQALIAAILSALAGTIIQRALQSQKRNAYVVTVELSIMGELTILLWSLTTADNGFFSRPQPAVGTVVPADGAAGGLATHAASTVMALVAAESESGLWTGWTFGTFFALFCQACGGVVVGFVIKYCGNVEKSFAVVVGMIITALLEKQYNGKPFGTRGLVAIVMVATATIMYTMYPPKQPTSDEDRANKKTPTTKAKASSVIKFYNRSASAYAKNANANSKKKDSEVAIELEPFLPANVQSSTAASAAHLSASARTASA